MHERVRKLIGESGHLALATARKGLPHVSLMAYVWDHGEGCFYVATGKKTRKYANMKENPRVSLLLDTRGGGPMAGVNALTVAGECRQLADGEARTVLARLTAIHGHLKGLISDKETVAMRIDPVSFELLQGPVAASYHPA